jgi:transposase-like protein
MESGLSGVEYCRRHGLKPRSLYRWRRIFSVADGVDALQDTPADTLGKAGILGASESAPVFAEVRVAALQVAPDVAGRAANGGVEVVLSGARRLRVAPGFDSETLARAVRVLESLPC